MSLICDIMGQCEVLWGGKTIKFYLDYIIIESWSFDITPGQNLGTTYFLGKSKLFLVVFTYYYGTGGKKTRVCRLAPCFGNTGVFGGENHRHGHSLTYLLWQLAVIATNWVFWNKDLTDFPKHYPQTKGGEIKVLHLFLKQNYDPFMNVDTKMYL